MRQFIAFVALALLGGAVSANCACQCVNGQVRPICTGALDLPPICSPQLCPLVPPAIQPLQAPMLAPLGTQSCQPAQVLNPLTGQYQWRTVCR